WALLSLSTIVGGTLLTLFLPVDDLHPWTTRYFLVIVGFAPYVPLHAALAYPVVHPILVRRRGVLGLIYGAGALQAVANVAGWYAHYAGPVAYTRAVGAGALLVGMALLIGRCVQLALAGRDPLITQRARILLAGSVLGITPFALVQFAREGFGALEIDNRFLI